MLTTTLTKLRNAQLAGLMALVAVGVGGSLLATAVAEEGRPLLVSFVWGVCGSAWAIQLLLWRQAARLLQSDREAGVSAARDRHASDIAVLAGGFAHEARNTLNALRSRIALLRKRVVGDDNLTRRVDQVQEIGVALEDLVTDFLTFGRPAADELTAVPLAELIAEVLDLEQEALQTASISVECEIDPDAVVVADCRKLKRAIQNLVVNARQAMCDGGVLRLIGSIERRDAVLEVSDTGVGIPSTSIARVFETYFSTKPEGTGLGLAIVRQTIEGFGGSVGCDSIEGRGTTMTVRLPLAANVEEAMSRREAVAVGESA